MTSWVLENVRVDELLKEIETKVLKGLESYDRLYVEIELLC